MADNMETVRWKIRGNIHDASVLRGKVECLRIRKRFFEFEDCAERIGIGMQEMRSRNGMLV
jgi:hypothetical protein